MPAGVLPRLLAAKVLHAVMHHRRSLKAELARVLPKLNDHRDRALLEAMCFSALRRRHRYERALQSWLQTPLKRSQSMVHALLLVGLAQIEALQLPAHAALSATVDTARALGFPRHSGLINALLRRAQRQGVAPCQPEENWPSWLLEQVRTDWPQQAQAIIAASAVSAPLWLRVNPHHQCRADYVNRLQAAGIQVQSSSLAVDALYLPTAVPVAHLPEFTQGAVSVQDLAAQLVADALQPARGARILDACAAPGGKTAHLLERDRDLQITALDVDAQRARRIHATLKRLNLEKNIRIHHADATAPATWWDGQPFDAIVLDAPCSATGIIRRQPDILLHRQPEDIEALVRLQARLLDALWPLLRPGGVLLYTTCSILRVENEQQIRDFIARTPTAQIDPLPAHFGHRESGMAQRFPGEEGGDGFFYARLINQCVASVSY